MKRIITTFSSAACLLGFIASASPALAYPTVGDSVEFENRIEKSESQAFTVKTTMTLTAHDSRNSRYQLTVVNSIGGESESKESWVEAADLFTQAALTQILTYCTEAGGTLQTVQVAAGTFKTCALPHQDGSVTGTYWIGDVPFGVIKADLLDKESGQRTVTTLQTYKIAQ